MGSAAALLSGEEWDLVLHDLNLRFPPSDASPLLHFGRWEDQPHQHLPAARLAASNWKGLMVADEVGLGKTISALHVLRRLHAMGEKGGVLIAVPSGLRLKWLQEMYHRCDLDGFLADSGAKLKQAFKRIREGESLVVVTSHGILRQPALLRQVMEEGMPQLMLTIIDEAHHCRNPRSRLHDAVQLVTLNSTRTLLLTATPINLSDEELWVQLSLLATDRWPDYVSFRRSMRPARILNMVLDATSRPEPELRKAADTLAGLRVVPGYDDDPRVDELLDLFADPLGWRGTNVEKRRREVADLLRQLRPLNDLLVRTRRRDLDLHLARRNAITLDVSLTDAEWRLYETARRWTWRLMQLRHPDSERFDWALVVPERMASSCLPAFATHVRTQLKTAARSALDFGAEGGEEVDELTLEEAETRLLRRFGDPDELQDAAEALGERDSKYEALSAWIRDSLAADQEGGILLFSHFLGTLSYLEGRLRQEGIVCAILSGKTAMADRERLRAEFAAGRIDVLLSSEVGSEGLDQQHCHRLVNYDLPWNPMRIEQRIGRLDRFGQQAEIITILNIAVEGTIDAAILGRLFHRIRLFEDSIGMLDPMLGKAMRMVATKELTNPLARRMRGTDFVLMDAEQAAEREVGDEDDELDSLLARRDGWLEERSNEEREWIGPDPGIRSLRQQTLERELGVTPELLVQWVQMRLGQRDRGSSLFHAGGLWQLRLSEYAVDELAARNDDAGLPDRLTRGWVETVRRLQTQSASTPHIIPVVIGRDAARERPDVTSLTPWHPLIQWLRSAHSGQPDEDAPLDGWVDAGIAGKITLSTTRPSDWCEDAQMVVALDWVVDGLSRHAIRRWLVLDEKGYPIPHQPNHPWKSLENLRKSHLGDEAERLLEDSLDQLHRWLLNDEKRRQSPLLDELRHNSHRAWMGKIDREREQIQKAQFHAQKEGKNVDHRWLRMKQGLIERLRVELDERIVRLNSIRESMRAELSARIVITLE